MAVKMIIRLRADEASSFHLTTIISLLQLLTTFVLQRWRCTYCIILSLYMCWPQLHRRQLRQDVPNSSPKTRSDCSKRETTPTATSLEGIVLGWMSLSCSDSLSRLPASHQNGRASGLAILRRGGYETREISVTSIVYCRVSSMHPKY